MDILEVYDFVYGYMLRKISHDVSNFPDWVKGEQDEREYLEESDTETDYTR